MVFEPRGRHPLDAGLSALWYRAIGRRTGGPIAGQRPAQVLDAAGTTLRPRLAHQLVTHVAPHVERLGQRIHGYRAPPPAERREVRREPELHRLRLHRPDVLEHAMPAPVAPAQLATDVGEGRNRDAEDHVVEFVTAAQHALLDVLPAAPRRLAVGPDVPRESRRPIGRRATAPVSARGERTRTARRASGAPDRAARTPPRPCRPAARSTRSPSRRAQRATPP